MVAFWPVMPGAGAAVDLLQLTAPNSTVTRASGTAGHTITRLRLATIACPLTPVSDLASITVPGFASLQEWR